MILLNGLPAVFGLGVMHVTLLNLIAIAFEYMFIKNRLYIPKLFLRTVCANLLSLIAGLIVFLTIPELMRSNIFSDHKIANYDILALFAGLGGMFLTNVALEIPAYFIACKSTRSEKFSIIKIVFYANLISNIPVFLLYSLLIFS